MPGARPALEVRPREPDERARPQAAASCEMTGRAGAAGFFIRLDVTALGGLDGWMLRPSPFRVIY